MSAFSLPSIWTPGRDRLCPTCGKPRARKRRSLARRLLDPLALFAAGGSMVNATGQEILKSDGSILLDDGAGNLCCCDPLYRARKCTDNTLANLYVHKSAFPSYPSTFYFYDLASDACYYVQSTDTAAAGSTPIASGTVAVGPGAAGPCCTPGQCNQCTGNQAPDRFSISFSGITYASCVLDYTGNYISMAGTDLLGNYEAVGPFGSDLTLTNCPAYDVASHATCQAGTICMLTYFYSDAACSIQTGNSGTTQLIITYGPPSSENAFGGATGVGWDIRCSTDSGQIFRGFTATAGDCFSPVTVTNTNISIGAHDPYFASVFAATRVFATGGSCVITPEA